MTIVVVNHAHSNVCGIHDLGRRIATRLGAHRHTAYVEAHSAADLIPSADVTLFNYRSDLMPWVVPALPAIHGVKAAILHNYDVETLDVRAGELLTAGFDRVVVLDPGATPFDRRVVVTGRFLPDRADGVAPPNGNVLRIGSFGFAFPHKRFERVAQLAAGLAGAGFPVVYRLHTPEAYFNGVEGRELYAPGIRDACMAEIGNATFEHTIDHRSDDEVVAWLAGNHVNCLLYESGQPDAGLSSALDYLLAARRPIVVSDAAMFRHGSGVATVAANGTTQTIDPHDADPVCWLADHYDSTAATQLLKGLAA